MLYSTSRLHLEDFRLLAQTLAASTYPLELIQFQQWLEKHKNLRDKELADAVAKQPWDPSIQAMAALPDVVKRLADDIQWTTDLGNAFLVQQSDVMDAVQRMRQKAQDKGNLKSTEQQKSSSWSSPEARSPIQSTSPLSFTFCVSGALCPTGLLRYKCNGAGRDPVTATNSWPNSHRREGSRGR